MKSGNKRAKRKSPTFCHSINNVKLRLKRHWRDIIHRCMECKRSPYQEDENKKNSQNVNHKKPTSIRCCFLRSNRPTISHDPHNRPSTSNLDKSLVPAQQNAHLLTTTTFTQVASLDLGEARILRRNRLLRRLRTATRSSRGHSLVPVINKSAIKSTASHLTVPAFETVVPRTGISSSNPPAQPRHPRCTRPRGCGSSRPGGSPAAHR